MEIGLSQVLKQEQTLSPQMLQSLALLTLPVQDLKTRIQEEIEKNPALEIPETETGSLSQGDSSSQSEREDSMDDYSGSSYELSSFRTSDAEASDRKQEMIENTPVCGESLSEHLLQQLGESSVSDSVREISEMLIGNLDENGFFILSLDKLFEESTFAEEDIKSALKLVRSFEPYGICVADFRESLVLQAECSGMGESDLKIFKALVYDCLEKINSGKKAEVERELKISSEDLDAFCAVLKSFTPHPGRNYSSECESYVSPEFSVRNRDGVLVLTINRDSLPVLEISPSFISLGENLSGPDSKETARYINASVADARLLIKQVEMRYRTIYKAASALTEAQHDFFMYGPKYLKALSLREIAEKIGVHETTMSRLAQNKWVDTDFGLFQLKYFFSQGVLSDSGEALSRNAVKNLIGEIISENPKLSDQKISDMLKEKGISCARRTVSKYRAELNINSSFSRK